MYEIKKKKVEVNGVRFDTFERVINDTETYKVEVGTNGYKGGNASKGCRALLSIKGLNGSSVAAIPLKKSPDCEGGFIFATSGDNGLYGLLKSLKFAVKVLENQIMEVKD